MTQTTETLVHIDAPHFRAGVVVVNGRVVRSADILAWMTGRSASYLRAYCRRKGWRAFTYHSRIAVLQPEGDDAVQRL